MMNESQDPTDNPEPQPGWSPVPPVPQVPPYAPHAAGGPQQPPPPAPQLVVAPKNPALSLLVSFFIPGVGSMMNGEVGAGIAILACYIVSWFLVFVLIGIILLPAVWVMNLVHAYQGAKRWNLQHGIIS